MSALPPRARLFDDIDGLGDAARLAHVIALARAARDPGELDAWLLTLLDGRLAFAMRAYAGRLAVAAARATGRVDVLLVAADNDSASVSLAAARALGPNVRVGDATRLRTKVAAWPAQTRHAVLQSIGVAGDAALCDALFAPVLESLGAPSAALLLVGCSTAIVAEGLPRVAHAIASMGRLALRQPEVVVGYIEASVREAPASQRASVWAHLVAATKHLARMPAMAVRLAKLALDTSPPELMPAGIADTLPALMRTRTDLAHALVTRPLALVEVIERVVKHVGRFSDAQLSALAEVLRGSPALAATVLDALPPSRRAAVYDAAFPERVARKIPTQVITALPHALRASEAERHLELPDMLTSRAVELELVALLPPERALPRLLEMRRSPDANERAGAYAAMVRSVIIARSGVAALLDAFALLKNEQDPVRAAAWTALAAMPPHLLRLADLPVLEERLTDIVEARDSSLATRGAAQRLALALLAHHAREPTSTLFVAACRMLERLAQQTGTLSLPSLEKRLPRGSEGPLVDTLLGVMTSALARENYTLLFALCTALGKRADDVPRLHELLEKARSAKPDWVGTRATTLWLAGKRHRDTRVQQLIREDVSAIALPVVFQHVHLRRQEWLDQFLTGKAIRGRYLTGKTVYVLPATDGFERWLPRQQEAHARLLWRIVDDATRPAMERALCTQRLGRLLITEPAAFDTQLASTDVSVIEGALQALSCVDVTVGVAERLLRFVDGDRARVAMYAYPAVARRLAPAVLAAQLQELLDRQLKVTVRKEALRLLALVPHREAGLLLRRELVRENTHRDARIALGHAARAVLGDAGHAVLEALAGSSDRYVAASILTPSPLVIPRAERQRYVSHIFAVARHADGDARKQAFARLAFWVAGAEEAIAREAGQRLVDNQARREWREVLTAFVASIADGGAATELERVVRTLAAAPTTPEHDAGPTRDRPAAQRLDALVATLIEAPASTRMACRPALLSASAALLADALLVPRALVLRLAAVDFTAFDLGQTLLAAVGDVDASPIAAIVREACVQVTERYAAERVDAARATQLSASDVLARDPSVTAGELAVALVAVVGRHTGWSPDARSRLVALRRDVRSSVRFAALAVITAAE